MLSTKSRSFWCLIFLVGLLPLFSLVGIGVWGDLGSEPAKYVVEYLGESALWVLLLTLAVTPLKRFASLSWLLRFRRMIGLYCLFYASLHLLAYGLLLVDWFNFVEDLYQRPYVMVGMLAFVILLLLGITSPKRMLRKLGRRWKSLHRLIYVSVVLVLVHVWWQSRSDYAEVVMFAVFALVLLSFRHAYFKQLLLRQ